MFQRLRKIFGVTGGTQTGTPDEEIIQGLSGPPRTACGGYPTIRSVGGSIDIFYGNTPPRPTIHAFDVDETLTDDEWEAYRQAEDQRWFREKKLEAARRDGYTGDFDDDFDGDDYDE